MITSINCPSGPYRASRHRWHYGPKTQVSGNVYTAVRTCTRCGASHEITLDYNLITKVIDENRRIK